MYKNLNQSLDEAYSLLEEDEFELDVIDVDAPTEEITLEDKPETVEERIADLEVEVKEIKDMLENPDNISVDSFNSSTETTMTPEENFANDVYECFMKLSKCPDDVELTEEFLDKRPYSDCWIPQVATRKRVSRNEVKNILLNRQKGSDNEN